MHVVAQSLTKQERKFVYEYTPQTQILRGEGGWVRVRGLKLGTG